MGTPPGVMVAGLLRNRAQSVTTMKYADNGWSRRSDLRLKVLSELTEVTNGLLMRHFEQLNGSLLHAQNRLILQIGHHRYLAMPRPQSVMEG